MASKSPAQARLMAGAAHDPEFAAKVGVPQHVAKEFNQADKGTGMIRPKHKRAKGKGKLSKAINDAMDKHGV